MKLLLLFISIVASVNLLQAQKNLRVEIITSGTNTSLRGMSIPNENIIWVSGSNGTIGKSVDGGKQWKWMVVPGFEKKDFRDIEAFDSSTAIAMVIDNPAYILKTTDGGKNWRIVFEKRMEGMFLDAMDFKNAKEGICIGDPVRTAGSENKRFYTIRTTDGGETWHELPIDNMLVAKTGEAIFSGSGTNISFLENSRYEFAFVTGGSVSNLHLIGKNKVANKSIAIPTVIGKESAGIFSMATDKKQIFYTIGGDYRIPHDTTRNYFYTSNAGTYWKQLSLTPPFGYRSCIRIIKDKTLIACGTTGIDYAANGTMKWQNISTESFNVCMVSKNRQVFFAGEKGKIGRLIY